MADSIRPYSESTDIYCRLLADAQRVEDRKLVRLVVQRLKAGGHLKPEAPDGRDVIRFPRPLAAAEPAMETDLFWQDHHFWQTLVQFLSLLMAGALWLVLPFILTALLTAP